jgi:hypothetical protein
LTFAVCWFVARDIPPERVRSRAASLARWYGVGAEALSVVELPEHRVVLGAIGLDARAPRLDGSVAWGSLHPFTPEELVSADEATRRRWTGPGAVAVWDERGVTVLSAAVDIATLYAAGDTVWSTHAAAAAMIAHGHVSARPDALPELLAFGHPVGGGTLVEGAFAMPAMSFEVEPPRGVFASSWGPHERWVLPAEEHAADAAARAVEAHVAARAGEGEAFLGLSAGLDSRVAAAAMRRAGVPFTAFTWGGDDDPDVAGARAIAEALGVEHRVVGATWLGDEEGLERSLLDARRSDGTAPFGFAAPSDALPPGVTTFSGMGGELGRAFHYAYLARSRPNPNPQQVRQAWRPERRLPDGVPDEGVRQAAQRAVGDAAEIRGIDGWRILDVVYARLRMRVWGRGGIRATPGTLVPVFLEPEVAAALVGLPLEDRLTDGFHRRYLAEHAPDLAHIPLPPVRGQRSGVPRALRRVAGALRAARPAPPEPATRSGLLRDRPATAAHLDDVLASPLVAEGLGEQAAARLRERLAVGDARATEIALALAAPVALT